MSRSDEPPLSEHVPSRVDERRLASQWSAISTRLAPPPRRRPLWLAVPALAVALLLVLVGTHFWRSARTNTDVATATSAANEGAARPITLPDGSRVVLNRETALVVERADAERVHLVLDSGAIEVDATHREGRSFVVTAGGHEVTVVGTLFRVEASQASGRATLTVEVTRGLVRVEGPSGIHLLGAGQRWTTTVDGPAVATAPIAPTAGDDSAPVASSEPVPVEPPSTRVVASPEGPRELLARATEARTKGRHREAAGALDTLRKRHRTDARAGLAAFELGRVRLDALGDPAGAAEAFADAIALSPNATFREDAEARRVEALDLAGQRVACEQARSAYLERYPSGIHARQVSQRCRPR